MDIKEIVSERLKIVRGKMSQAEFAERLGIHKNTLGNYERGQSSPDFGLLLSVCTVFGVSPDWLLTGAGPKLRKDAVNEPADHTQTQEGLEDLRRENRELRKDNRDLMSDNRELVKENRELMRENGDLRVELERMKAKALDRGTPNESQRKTG